MICENRKLGEGEEHWVAANQFSNQFAKYKCSEKQSVQGRGALGARSPSLQLPALSFTPGQVCSGAPPPSRSSALCQPLLKPGSVLEGSLGLLRTRAGVSSCCSVLPAGDWAVAAGRGARCCLVPSHEQSRLLNASKLGHWQVNKENT